ncbi:hypothetical protein SPRG_03255 [Saprolegnia parasitica CBS 223.65]|uniref:MYND-type domain-containing protein n=1 Tax=Saprolegnia parasitica (strain CBS 223.65) TaxID=695850 RepID=A0A067CNE5_SAPPC|nr:hypothetical protein SPRG_03255 [Saprolegnia parasitica CBS 223.65]KDO32038.1 hypothetical protein SPRG_03255 [Saprolegnia parasitica CBS 223.65]|eukprot:XP_012197226.1 hypothetical protein SPRG_03255 [Saprolegnia parasitica CBS 223.65]
MSRRGLPPQAPAGIPDMQQMMQAMMERSRMGGDGGVSGSDDEFDEEFDDDDNYDDDYAPLKPTRRTPASEARLELRQSQMFVPRRCEVVGCDRADVKHCAKCRCVFYCGREHQLQDWPRHKIDCKHIASLGLSGIPYNEADELRKYPIGCFPVEASDLETCFVCGAGENEVNLGTTECCGLTVCDNEHEYQMMSYSRTHCMRSHNRYTTCGSHANEGHGHSDWRTCPHVDCAQQRESPDDEQGGGGGRSWYSTNGFNSTPMLGSSIPKGSMITGKCATCPRRLLSGWEGVTMSRAGTQCTRCSAH